MMLMQDAGNGHTCQAVKPGVPDLVKLVLDVCSIRIKVPLLAFLSQVEGLERNASLLLTILQILIILLCCSDIIQQVPLYDLPLLQSGQVSPKLEESLNVGVA